MKPTHNLAVKIIAVFFVVFWTAAVSFGGVSLIWLIDQGALEDGANYFNSTACHQMSYYYSRAVVDIYRDFGGQTVEYIDGNTAFSSRRTNFGFEISTKDEEVLVAYNCPENPAFTNVYSFSYDDGSGYIVTAYLPESLSVDDEFSQGFEATQALASRWQMIVWGTGISALALLSTVIFLCCAGGHRSGRDDIQLNLQDRIPYDLFLGLAFGAVCLVFGIGSNFGSWDRWYIIVAGVIGTALGLIAIDVLLSTATRIKAGKLLSNTIVFRVCRMIWHTVLFVFKGTAGSLRTLRIEWRTGLAAIAVMFLQFCFMALAMEGAGFFFFILLLLDMALLVVACKMAYDVRKLMIAGEKLAGGDVEYKTDVGKMYFDFKKHGSNLNSIGDGLHIAVDQRMKSERLKTELITNVSHDIKTPLTSIINYVDLLKKENVQGQAAEYIEVLDRQSVRLKKLTDDLVEASKAATGNVSVMLTPTGMCELVSQALGEYKDKLELAGLEPVLAVPEEEMYIMADGRLIWRVVDNLLNNACKYSQAGTRVYIGVRQQADKGILSVRNVSRDRLDVHPDELTERFVRGDSARTTEGSGLGLNIARSLTELQGGKLNLSIDGDLFKAEVSFDVVKGR